MDILLTFCNFARQFMFCARSKCVLSRVTCHMLREVYRLFDSTKVGQDACLAWSMPVGVLSLKEFATALEVSIEQMSLCCNICL